MLQQTTNPQYMTRKEAAVYLAVSEKWLAQSGRFIGPTYYKFGHLCRYLQSDLDHWARQQRVAR